MTVQNDLDTTWQEKEQREDAFAGRAALEDCTNVIEQTHLYGAFNGTSSNGSINVWDFNSP